VTFEKVNGVEVADAPRLEVTAKRADGTPVTFALSGIKPAGDAAEARAELAALLERARGVRVARDEQGRGLVEYLAMQDRSGQIWVDVGRELVALGVAVTDGTDFPRRAEYEHTEQQVVRGETPRYPLE
jgi:hypothetical protein